MTRVVMEATSDYWKPVFYLLETQGHHAFLLHTVLARIGSRPGGKESAGKKKGRAITGRGNRYLAQVLGEAAVAAGCTNTFLGDRYRRLARRRGAARAVVAVGRSILVSIWHLLSDPETRYRDLGADYNRQRTTRFPAVGRGAHGPRCR